MTPQPRRAAAGSERLAELDVLRGFAVAVMILVVSPGAWEYSYAQLQHADWHGWTFADLVFPDFLFGVGMALGLTFGRSLDPAGDRRAFWIKVLRRVALLLALGVLLNGLSVVAGMLGAAPVGPTEERTWRIPGVLQRIGVCYLIAVLAVMAAWDRRSPGGARIRPWVILAIIAALLLGYWAALTFVPVPGFGAGVLDKTGNLAAHIDRAVFTPEHMWALGAETWRGPVVYDPEGLLSTLPATANVLFGVLAIGVWRARKADRVLLLAQAGAAMIALALLLDGAFPINKKLWTGPFALLTTGFSCLALVLAWAVLSVRGGRTLLAPLRILGTNALLAFALSLVLSAVGSVPLPLGDTPRTLQQFGFAAAHSVITDPYLASLACALGVLGFVVAAVWPITRRGIYLRV